VGEQPGKRVGHGARGVYPWPQASRAPAWTITSLPAPLYFVSPGQVNAEVFHSSWRRAAHGGGPLSGRCDPPLDSHDGANDRAGHLYAQRVGSGDASASRSAQSYRPITSGSPAQAGEWIQILWYRPRRGEPNGNHRRRTSVAAAADQRLRPGSDRQRAAERLLGRPGAGWVELYAVNLQFAANLAPAAISYSSPWGEPPAIRRLFEPVAERVKGVPVRRHFSVKEKHHETHSTCLAALAAASMTAGRAELR